MSKTDIEEQQEQQAQVGRNAYQADKQRSQEAARNRREVGQALDNAGETTGKLANKAGHNIKSNIAVAGTVLGAPLILGNHLERKSYDYLHGMSKDNSGDWTQDRGNGADSSSQGPQSGHTYPGESMGKQPQQHGLAPTGYTPGKGINTVSQPNGGVSINVDGHNVNLQPGTSVTIGKDGQASFNNTKLDPNSVQASQHPFDHTIDQQGFSRQYGAELSNYNAGLSANPNDPNAAYQQSFGQNGQAFSPQAFQNSQQMRKAYDEKGYHQTAAGIGEKQETAVKGEINKEKQSQKGKNKSLDVDGPEVNA